MVMITYGIYHTSGTVDGVDGGNEILIKHMRIDLNSLLEPLIPSYFPISIPTFISRQYLNPVVNPAFNSSIFHYLTKRSPPRPILRIRSTFSNPHSEVQKPGLETNPLLIHQYPTIYHPKNPPVQNLSFFHIIHSPFRGRETGYSNNASLLNSHPSFHIQLTSNTTIPMR